jgi:hypothetical protein
MLFLFTTYYSLTLLSFESFHIALVREMFTPRQSTVNEVTRGIRHSVTIMLCGLLSNLLYKLNIYLHLELCLMDYLKFFFSKVVKQLLSV